MDLTGKWIKTDVFSRRLILIGICCRHITPVIKSCMISIVWHLLHIYIKVTKKILLAPYVFECNAEVTVARVKGRITRFYVVVSNRIRCVTLSQQHFHYDLNFLHRFSKVLCKKKMDVKSCTSILLTSFYSILQKTILTRKKH